MIMKMRSKLPLPAATRIQSTETQGDNDHLHIDESCLKFGSRPPSDIISMEVIPYSIISV